MQIMTRANAVQFSACCDMQDLDGPAVLAAYMPLASMPSAPQAQELQDSHVQVRHVSLLLITHSAMQGRLLSTHVNAQGWKHQRNEFKPGRSPKLVDLIDIPILVSCWIPPMQCSVSKSRFGLQLADHRWHHRALAALEYHGIAWKGCFDLEPVAGGPDGLFQLKMSSLGELARNLSGIVT